MDNNQRDTTHVSTDPKIDTSAAVVIAEANYGVTGTVHEIGGERDQNFRVDGADGETFVLKVSESYNEEIIDFQMKAIRQINDSAPELPVVEPVSTVSGAQWTTVNRGDSEKLVRVFKFIPSADQPISEVDSESLIRYGAVVARVGQALRGFFHPAARRDTPWNFRNAPELRPSLSAVADDRNRAIADDVLDRFEEFVQPTFGDLRGQVVHNDLRPDNVLLDESNEVTGIIDFGDLTHTALVSDIAVALASVMYRCPEPIDAGQSVIEGYSQVTPLEKGEIRLLPDLIMTRLAMKGIMYSREEPNYSHNAGSEDEIWALLGELKSVGHEAIRQQLRVAAASSDSPYSRIETNDLLARRRQVLGSERLSYREPVHFVSGDGVWIFDESGDRYLDAYNNVQSVGHANSRVSAAVHSQNRKLSTNTRYLHDSIVELSENLLETMPEEIDQLIFVSSGSEANDLAWQMAANWTGSNGAIVSDYAYHGITSATKNLSPKYWPSGKKPSNLETITPPANAAEQRYTGSDSVGEIETALNKQEASGCETAALVFDPLFTSDGIFPPSSEELKTITERVRKAGGINIVDEVQAGFGRTGTDMWGFQAAEITPDIVTLGKPMGNGYPVAAVGARSEIVDSFRQETGVFSTFGGNPVACAAALATLGEIKERDLLTHASDVSSYMETQIEAVAAEYDLVGEVRQKGLMCGVELVRNREAWVPAQRKAKDVVNYLRQNRVLIGVTGRNNNVLKIRPPLIFTREHVDRLTETLDGALNEVSGRK